MAKKIFALEMKGVAIRTLEDLRENFELEKAIGYFKSGELSEWLADRFYEDEVEVLEKISADDINLTAKLCAALNVVDCDNEFSQRIKAKRALLAEKTDDENILANAAVTALNQDDLANLLNLDYQTIYLCGENFTVPIRITDRKYIGILSTPKIKIKATSDAELAEKNIVFENCKLEWRKETQIEALKALAAKIFGTNGEWQIVDKDLKVVSSYDKLSAAEKSIAVDMCCHGKYTESQVVFLYITEDISDGFAFTTDSFCTGGASGGNIFKYNEITDVFLYYSRSLTVDKKDTSRHTFRNGICSDNQGLNLKVKKFLDVVKNL